MKYFLRNTVAFILFFAIAYCLFLFLFNQMPNKYAKKNLRYLKGSHGHLYSRLEEAKKRRDVDVLFIGSSHCYRTFDNRIFAKHGYNTFNLGSSSQTPLQSQYLLKRYLNILKPKLVVIEVYPANFEGDGVESTLDLVSNEELDFSLFELVLKTRNATVINTFVYKVLTDFFMREKFTESKVKDDDIYVSGGFVEKKLSFYRKINSVSKSRHLFIDKQFETLKQITTQLSESKIAYVFVFSPIIRNSYLSYTDNAIFTERIRNMGHFINYNDSLILDDSLHFYDNNHLNQNGVKVFDERFAKSLPALMK